MICTTIQNRTKDEIIAILENPIIEMAEIRIDRCNLSGEDLDEIFSQSDIPLVATCRVSEVQNRLSETELSSAKQETKATQIAESQLIRAIQAGAAYVDIEIEAPAMMSKRIRREAQEYGTILIRSFHDFNGTDSSEALKAIAEKCRNLGAELVKIATTAKVQTDVNRVLSLYNDFEPANLIAFCMGETGKNSRMECLEKGAPFTYTALNAEETAAPGQWTVNEAFDRLYSGTHRVNARLQMPCSKSFAQRAIIIAALAEGTSILHNYSPCGDNESAIKAAKALGADVKLENNSLIIRGIGDKVDKFDADTFHTGESGFLTRMMIPVLSHIGKGNISLTGEKTLLNRPLKGAKDIMEKFGVNLIPEKDSDEVFVPLRIEGRLQGGNVEISGKDGSQIISGLLSALPLSRYNSTIYLTEPKSIPYIFITLEVLKKFGVRIGNEMEGGEEFLETQDWTYCDAITFRVKGGQKYKAAEIDLEADWSSAANFMVAGAIFGSVELSGLDMSSLQADLSITDILVNAGASLSQEEDSNIIHIRKAPLKAFEIDANNCPDLFPIISVLAAFSQGVSKITGIGRLANKESDRGKAIVEMLNQMGVFAKIKGDALLIEGHSLSQRLLSRNLLKGGKYTSHHDHRMVMALTVASLGADGPIEIDDVECVAKSFPTFFDLFARL